ncbi:MAG: hypothetical protein M3Z97_05090 [Candidatus Dormibacteraeota bacterium]|nr:hypothetical protein [Candidatus Dormibacteraeota bacterium]
MATPNRQPLMGPAALRLVVLALGLALLFGVAFLAARGNENAGILLFFSAVCAGLGLLRLLVALLQRFDGVASGIWGYERETVVIALALVALATPWRIDITLAGAGGILGWQSPVLWLVFLALTPSVSRRLARWESVGLAVSGAGLAAWLGWSAWLLFTPGFSRLHFPFQPLDLVGVGWYLALAAWVVAVEGAVARRGWERSGKASPFGVLPWAAVPGAGLIRLGRPALGRAYLLAAALMVFLLRLTAYTPADFAYNATNNKLPDPVPRTDAVVLAAILAVLWLASVVHTLAAVRRQSPSRQLPSLQRTGRQG